MFVLVVDDDAVQRKLVRAWLEPMGFSVITATNVIEAMQAMTEHSPIVLCMVDWHMHPWNGPSFISALRSEPRFANIPVLAFTADNDPQAVKQAASLQVEGYILKPLHRRVIADKLLALDLVETVTPARTAPGLPRALEARESLKVKIPVALDPEDGNSTKLYNIEQQAESQVKTKDETKKHRYHTAATVKQERQPTATTIKRHKSINPESENCAQPAHDIVIEEVDQDAPIISGGEQN